MIEQFEDKPNNNTIDSVLRRIVLATVVYHIWRERNSRLFNGEEIDWIILVNMIIESVKFQLLCLKVKKSRQVIKVEQEWGVKMCVV